VAAADQQLQATLALMNALLQPPAPVAAGAMPMLLICWTAMDPRVTLEGDEETNNTLILQLTERVWQDMDTELERLFEAEAAWHTTQEEAGSSSSVFPRPSPQPGRDALSWLTRGCSSCAVEGRFHRAAGATGARPCRAGSAGLSQVPVVVRWGCICWPTWPTRWLRAARAPATG
jgi:hypothetical protein